MSPSPAAGPRCLPRGPLPGRRARASAHQSPKAWSAPFHPKSRPKSRPSSRGSSRSSAASPPISTRIIILIAAPTSSKRSRVSPVAKACRSGTRAARWARPCAVSACARTTRSTRAFFDQGVSVARLISIIESLPGGSTELMCHPAHEDAELAASSSYARGPRRGTGGAVRSRGARRHRANPGSTHHVRRTVKIEVLPSAAEVAAAGRRVVPGRGAREPRARGRPSHRTHPDRDVRRSSRPKERRGAST